MRFFYLIPADNIEDCLLYLFKSTVSVLFVMSMQDAPESMSSRDRQLCE